MIPRIALVPWLALVRAIDAVAVPCRTDPEAWTGDDRARWTEAAEACRGCPVLELCQAYAETAGESWGVWGATVRSGVPEPSPACDHPREGPAQPTGTRSEPTGSSLPGSTGTCSRCGRQQPLTHFVGDGRGGRRRDCRGCTTAAARVRARRRRERLAS